MESNITASITFAGMQTLLRRMRETGAKGTGKYTDARSGRTTEHLLTSEDLKKLFKSNPKLKGRLHLMSEFSDCYVMKIADIAVTYTWTTDLEKQLPAYLNELVGIFGPNVTFWIDIFFNDQNTPDIKKELAEAENLYSRAKFHAVVLSNSPLQRGWCLYEIAIRTAACQRQGKAPDSMFICLPNHVQMSDFYVKELNFKFYKSRVTGCPNDRHQIQLTIMRIFRTPERFNETVVEASATGLRAFIALPSPEAFGCSSAQQNARDQYLANYAYSGYIGMNSPWPEDQIFRDNGAGKCTSCQKPADQHTVSGHKARCFLPDIK